MARHKFVLLGTILLGFILRLFILSQRGSFWFDEAFSTHFAAMDLGGLWSYLKFENNPPFYFVLLHFWMKLFGTSELAVRSLSMMFGIAAIPMVYVIGQRLHSSTAGNFAAFLAAISTFQVFYSTETRMYTLYLFLTLLATWLFIQITDHLVAGRYINPRSRINVTRERWQWVGFCVVVSLLVWTHITAWLIVTALVVYRLWAGLHHKRADRTFCGGRMFAVIVGLTVLSLLPWLVNFLRLKIANPLSQGWFFYIPPDRNFFLTMLETLLTFGQDNAFIITLLSVVIVALLVFAVRRLTPAVKFLLCWLFVPLLIGFAFQNAVPRYFIAVAPALYLLLGIGFSRAADSLRSYEIRRRLVWVIPLVIAALVLPDYPSLAKIGNHQWDRLALWVKQVEGVRCQMSGVRCLILVNPHSEVLALERYYKGVLPVVGFYPRQDDWDRDMRIVRTNWVSLANEKNIHTLADITAGYKQVFLITGETDPDAPRNLIPTWFWNQGWNREDELKFGRQALMVLSH